MLFLLDTTAFSDLMRAHPKMDAHLAALPPEDHAIVCSIVRGEITYGVHRLPEGRRRADLQAKATRLFAVLRCDPVPPEAGDHYAQIKLARQQKGLALDENDLWIAATAVALGARLVSRDDDFRAIDGLEVENWLA